MGFLSRTLETRGQGSVNSLEELLRIAGAASQTSSGQSVSVDSATSLTAAYNAIRIISETLGSVPLKLYRRLEDGGREEARDHPIWSLVHDQPSDTLTSEVWRETMGAHLNGWGNAYCKIGFNNRGLPGRIQVEQPSKTKVFRDEMMGRVKYEFRRQRGKNEVLPAGRVIHVPMIGFNGLTGMSPIQKMREAIGLSLSMRRFGAKFFTESAQPSGAVTVPGELGQEAYDRMKKDWQDAHTGEESWHEAVILEGGAEFQPFTVPQKDAQFLESRKFQIREIARVFNIQPAKIKDLEDAHFNNVVQSDIEFTKYTIRPIAVKIEQELNRKLIPEGEKDSLFIEHELDGLLRGDPETRAEFYKTATEHGVMTPNEARQRENLNPREGGDRLFFPKNMMEIHSNGSSSTASDEERQGQEVVDTLTRDTEKLEMRAARRRQETAKAFEDVFLDAGDTIMRRETREVDQIANDTLPQGDISEFIVRLEDFYSEDGEFFDFLVDVLRAPVRSLTEQIISLMQDEIDVSGFDAQEFVDQEVNKKAVIHTDRSFGQLVAIAEGRDRQEQVGDISEEQVQQRQQAVDERLDEWSENRPNKLAKAEAHNTANAVAQTAMKAADVTKKKWQAIGQNCPACDSLNGVVVGLEVQFAGSNEDVTGDGWFTNQPITRPPAHEG